MIPVSSRATTTYHETEATWHQGDGEHNDKQDAENDRRPLEKAQPQRHGALNALLIEHGKRRVEVPVEGDVASHPPCELSATGGPVALLSTSRVGKA